jgi:pyruvate dehydrogenase E1 component alpha subunit
VPINNEDLKMMYKKMLTIRRFEERVLQEFHNGNLPGFIHSYIGQEAIAVGVCAHLRVDDRIVSNHRGHGHCVAKGADMKRMMAEIYGKKTGYCKGKGGSMHIADLDLGILGANGIVGGGIGLATGAAYSAAVRGSGQVVVCFFGDGASNQGILLEAGNMASLWRLPIVYLCEANQYAEFSPVAPFIAVPRLELKAQALGMPGVTVDGNDVLAVLEATGQAVARARAGAGPTFLVAQTYRVEGHTVGDPLSYRPAGEAEQWKQPERDPVSRYEQRLLAEFGFAQEQLQVLRRQAEADIADAIAFAKASPEPELAALWEDVVA